MSTVCGYSKTDLFALKEDEVDDNFETGGDGDGGGSDGGFLDSEGVLICFTASFCKRDCANDEMLSFSFPSPCAIFVLW